MAGGAANYRPIVHTIPKHSFMWPIKVVCHTWHAAMTPEPAQSSLSNQGIAQDFAVIGGCSHNCVLPGQNERVNTRVFNTEGSN